MLTKALHKSRFRIYIFLLLAFILTGLSSFGQVSSDRVNFQTWTDFTYAYFHTEQFSFGGDAGLRGIVSGKNWNTLYIRPTIHFTVSPIFKVSGGIGSFNTFYKDFNNTYELRFFQDAHISWPDIGWIDFYQRFRFEERLFFYKIIENDISVRGRYLIRARTNDFRLIGKSKSFYLKGMWELFVPFDESAVELFINSQRFYFAIGHRVSEKFRYEVFYIWQKSREGQENQCFNRF